MHETDRAFVPYELELVGGPGTTNEVGILDLVLGESEVVVEGVGVERSVVVVVRTVRTRIPPRSGKAMPRAGRLPWTVHHR